MSHHIAFTPAKTYATQANAIKAVQAKFGPQEEFASSELRYVICTTEEGRFYPVFIGQSAIQRGAHFHFCCAA